MASGKDKHYWAQLLATLTAGSWDVSLPAKAPNGATLPWSELLRKFNKHCPGHQDVAELASQTQALSLLLSANATDLDGSDVGSQGVLVLGDECRLAEERIDEALAGYDTLKQMDAGASDVREAEYAVNTIF